MRWAGPGVTKQDGLPVQSRENLLELGARQEGSSGPGLWELMLGQGPLSGLRLVGLPADLGASGICTIFCADFHAVSGPGTCTITRVYLCGLILSCCAKTGRCQLTPTPRAGM